MVTRAEFGAGLGVGRGAIPHPVYDLLTYYLVNYDIQNLCSRIVGEHFHEPLFKTILPDPRLLV